MTDTNCLLSIPLIWSVTKNKSKSPVEISIHFLLISVEAHPLKFPFCFFRFGKRQLVAVEERRREEKRREEERGEEKKKGAR